VSLGDSQTRWCRSIGIKYKNLHASPPVPFIRIAHLRALPLALLHPHAAQLVDEAVPVAGPCPDPAVGLERHEQLEQVGVGLRQRVALLLPDLQAVSAGLARDVAVGDGQVRLLRGAGEEAQRPPPSPMSP
jgi:hypothetical protein